jgi:hypothetical protein
MRFLEAEEGGAYDAKVVRIREDASIKVGVQDEHESEPEHNAIFHAENPT